MDLYILAVALELLQNVSQALSSLSSLMYNVVVFHTGIIRKPNLIQPYIAIGSGAGGLVLGLVLGGLIAWLVLRWSFKKKRESAQSSGTRVETLNGSATDSYRPLLATSPIPRTHSPFPPPRTHSPFPPSRAGHGMPYQVEPFHMPDEVGQLYHAPPSQSHASASGYTASYTASLTGVQPPTTVGHHDPLPPSTPPPPLPSVQSSAESPNARPRQVYVMHHDSGLPPVTIYHQEGTEVVELPPRWSPPTATDEWQSSSDARSASGSVSVSASQTQSQTEKSDTSKNVRSPGLSLHQPRRQPGSIRKLPGTPE